MRITDLLQEAIPPTPTGINPPAANMAPPNGTQPAQAGQQADQQVNPQVAALAIKQKQDQKKQIQDQISATEKQLQGLRKQLAQVQ